MQSLRLHPELPSQTPSGQILQVIHPHGKAEEALHWGKFPEFLNTDCLRNSWYWRTEWSASAPGGGGWGWTRRWLSTQPQEHKAEIPPCTLGKMKNEVLVSTPCP